MFITLLYQPILFLQSLVEPRGSNSEGPSHTSARRGRFARQRLRPTACLARDRIRSSLFEFVTPTQIVLLNFQAWIDLLCSLYERIEVDQMRGVAANSQDAIDRAAPDEFVEVLAQANDLRAPLAEFRALYDTHATCQSR